MLPCPQPRVVREWFQGSRAPVGLRPVPTAPDAAAAIRSRMMRVGVKPGQWGWSFDELEASWRAAENAGFDLLSCFDHVTSAPEGQSAWDGPSLLAAMAAATGQIRLGIHVLNASLRHPLLVAGQIAVAQAASGGRVEVGVGAGSPFRPVRLRPASPSRRSPLGWTAWRPTAGSCRPCGVERR